MNYLLPRWAQVSRGPGARDARSTEAAAAAAAAAAAPTWINPGTTA